MHARTPKHFVLEERLERYARAIELAPAAYAGRWAEACAPLGREPFGTVKLDLGCGKGEWLCEAAAAEPDVLWLGLDAEPMCIAYAAQHVCETGLPNAVLLPWNGLRVDEVFGAGELAAIHLNFPTPFPRRKEARKRLVAAARLMAYRPLLAYGGYLELRTDSEPLFAFAQAQLPLAGWELSWATDDDRAERPRAPQSEYERKLAAQGATVHALRAVPGAAPRAFAEPEPESLMDYLPADLTALDGVYVPHGMARAVVNFRNRDLRRAGRR